MALLWCSPPNRVSSEKGVNKHSQAAEGWHLFLSLTKRRDGVGVAPKVCSHIKALKVLGYSRKNRWCKSVKVGAESVSLFSQFILNSQSTELLT